MNYYCDLKKGLIYDRKLNFIAPDHLYNKQLRLTDMLAKSALNHI